MANSPQAKKRARQMLRRTAINKSRSSRIKTFIRQVEKALSTENGAAAAEALRQAQPEIMRGVTKGILHRNTARRKISRMARKIKAINESAAAK
ncbi:MAG: 30S ribosomal protein S20 [Albidovulum sp.]|nr:30S ribosomal protein S20 [Albidovulum sp.]MDE0532247.1 30S ribosomal protein S20 [Albidovulum sp.]